MSVISSLITQNSEIILNLYANKNQKIMLSNPIDGAQIANFISSLYRQQKVLLSPGGLRSPLEVPLWSSNYHSDYQIRIHCCF